MSKIYVDEIHPKTAGSAVKSPNIPAWRLGVVETNYTTTGWKDLPIDTSTTSLSTDNSRFINGGVTVSGGQVTVPVSGFYQVNYTGRADLVGSGYFQIAMEVNDTGSGSLSAIVDSPSSASETLQLSQVLYLEANDAIHFLFNVSSDTSYHIENNSMISGAFLG